MIIGETGSSVHPQTIIEIYAECHTALMTPDTDASFNKLTNAAAQTPGAREIPHNREHDVYGRNTIFADTRLQG